MSNLGTAYGGGFDGVCRLLRSTGREQVTPRLKRKELEAAWKAALVQIMFQASAKRVESTGMADEADGGGSWFCGWARAEILRFAQDDNRAVG